MDIKVTKQQDPFSPILEFTAQSGEDEWKLAELFNQLKDTNADRVQVLEVSVGKIAVCGAIYPCLERVK